MKEIAVVAVLVMALAWCGMAFAFQNEPEGFRGLKWGDPPTEDMVIFPFSKYGRANYRRLEEKLYLGDAKLQEVVYCFYDDQFMTVFLHFEEESNYELLETVCREKFGEPTKEEYDELVWITLETAVTLYYRFSKGTGAVMLADMEILDKCQRARQKEEAESAEKDW